MHPFGVSTCIRSRRAPRTTISFTTWGCCAGRANYNSARSRHHTARSAAAPSTAAKPPKPSDQRPFRIAPGGMTPCSTNRQSAIANLLATATIPTLRPRAPCSANLPRYHAAISLDGWWRIQDQAISTSSVRAWRQAQVVPKVTLVVERSVEHLGPQQGGAELADAGQLGQDRHLPGIGEGRGRIEQRVAPLRLERLGLLEDHVEPLELPGDLVLQEAPERPAVAGPQPVELGTPVAAAPQTLDAPDPVQREGRGCGSRAGSSRRPDGFAHG